MSSTGKTLKTVIKRDESAQPFNFTKIINAVDRAFRSTTDIFSEYEKLSAIKAAGNGDEQIDAQISSLHARTEAFTNDANKFTDYLKTVFDKMGNDTITVEEIQDTIQRELIKKNKYNVVESFILYRNKRAEARENKSKLIKDIKKALNATDIQNQNANMDEASFSGRIGEAGRVVCKDAALKMMSKMARKNHEDGWIYIHDLDSYAAGMHNCLTIPFDYALANGFKTRQTDVRPANSINTAFQLVAVIFQLQSLQQFGGVSASHIDWTMEPYVRKSFFKHYCDGLKYLKGMKESKLQAFIDAHADAVTTTEINAPLYTKHKKVYDYAMEKTWRETYQAIEGMYHNLNTLQSRSGGQLPFTSINYGTCTSVSGRMVTKALLSVSMNGLGKYHLTSIFPCGIFQYMKGVNDRPGTPNYDLYRMALQSTAKRIYPNYVNVDWSVNKGYDRNDPKTYCSTMGCRTYNGFDINGLGQQKDGRGNIAPVTIILPKVAMEAARNEDGTPNIDSFMSLLDKKIFEARDMLLERFEHICSQPIASARFMWENNMMAGYVPEEGVRSALKHGTLVIGQIGLAECLQALIGCDHTEERGMDLAKRIEQLFKDRCAQFKQEQQLNFGVYYTPAENLCYTAMKKFRAQYGIIQNVSDHEYFTNSMHVPVWHEMSPFQKIDIEAELTGYSNAGCITYVELPSTAMNNIDAIETIVNYAMDKDIPYFALNFPLDSCAVCHAQGDFNGVCPECGSTDINELRRVTGYLSTTKKHFNRGKQVECDERVKHIKN